MASFESAEKPDHVRHIGGRSTPPPASPPSRHPQAPVPAVLPRSSSNNPSPTSSRPVRAHRCSFHTHYSCAESPQLRPGRRVPLVRRCFMGKRPAPSETQGPAPPSQSPRRPCRPLERSKRNQRECQGHHAPHHHEPCTDQPRHQPPSPQPSHTGDFRPLSRTSGHFAPALKHIGTARPHLVGDWRRQLVVAAPGSTRSRVPVSAPLPAASATSSQTAITTSVTDANSARATRTQVPSLEEHHR
jgi:hypothetical protein